MIDTTKFELWIPGETIAKSRDYENLIALAAQQQIEKTGFVRFEGAVVVEKTT